MADKTRDPTIAALEAVYAALKDMDAAGRRKVLSSAFALLGVEGPPILSPSPQQSLNLQLPMPMSGRPVSLGELINEKKPGTNAQRIAIFAYYREKSEGISRFNRADLQPYFAKAKITPASNYDRDFIEAVRKGWIHEDESESYLTTKGIETIETAFEGEGKYTKGRKSTVSRKSTTKKKRARAPKKRR